MYTDITSAEEALKRNKDQIDLSGAIKALSFLPSEYSKGMIGLLTLQIVVYAVNNDDPNLPDWKADFNDEEQEKWFPWYVGGSADGSGSGFRFYGSYYVWADTLAYGGARLALKDQPRAQHMNKYFFEEYRNLWLILK